MLDNSENTIPIFEAVSVVPVTSEQSSRLTESRGGTRSVQELPLRMVEVSTEVLSRNLANFVEGVAAMLSASSMETTGFHIETVEVQCQVGGNGKIGFAGTGVDLQGGSTLKIVFKNKKQE